MPVIFGLIFRSVFGGSGVFLGIVVWLQVLEAARLCVDGHQSLLA